MGAIDEEIGNFQRIAPIADEATMVLKAHLLLQQSLWKFVACRLEDKKLLEELQTENSPVRNGRALIQLAQALAARDEVAMLYGAELWPALYAVNSLRNKLVHELDPQRKKIEKYMREIARSVHGEASDDLNTDFYYAALRILHLLGLARRPMDLSDVWSET